MPDANGRPTYDELAAENAALRRRIAEQDKLVERLTRRIEELERTRKRQAAPFSKGEPVAEPKKPGRKPGDDYGVKARRPVPESVDEVRTVAPPATCPDCGSAVEPTGETVHQWQTELTVKPVVRRFDMCTGACTNPACKRVVRGRHELQTSDAVGAAESQVGPFAQAVVVHLNKHVGASHAKTADLFARVLGVPLTRGAVSQIILRAGKKCEPDYEAIRASVRAADMVSADETGWRIAGRNAWQHVFATPTSVLYEIARSRGADVPIGVLDADFDGFLAHDGWAPYDKLDKAIHQQCLAHFLRRCKDLEADATGPAKRFPAAVKELLKEAIRLKDPAAVGDRNALSERLDALLSRRKKHPGNERFRKHLEKHRDELFTFLDVPGLEPTNWRAEQALRPAVVNRKVWGGNRTAAGARAQSVLTSVMRTCLLRNIDPLKRLTTVLCSRQGLAPPLPPA